MSRFPGCQNGCFADASPWIRVHRGSGESVALARHVALPLAAVRGSVLVWSAVKALHIVAKRPTGVNNFFQGIGRTL